MGQLEWLWGQNNYPEASSLTRLVPGWERVEGRAWLGWLTRVPTPSLTVWLGFPHSMAASR